MNDQSKEQRFSIQFVVLRDGQPITEVITIEGSPISLHEKHNPVVVWRVQAQIFVNLIHAELVKIDGLAGVVPDARPVGLAPQRANPKRRDPDVLDLWIFDQAERVLVPILKRVNAALTRLFKRLNKQQTAPGDSSVKSDREKPKGEQFIKDELARLNLKMVDYFEAEHKRPLPAPDDERSKPYTKKPRGGQDNQRGLR